VYVRKVVEHHNSGILEKLLTKRSDWMKDIAIAKSFNAAANHSAGRLSLHSIL